MAARKTHKPKPKPVTIPPMKPKGGPTKKLAEKRKADILKKKR